MIHSWGGCARGAHPPTDRLQRRLPPPGRVRSQPAAGCLALVGRVGQQVADRGRPPDRLAGRSRHPPPGEPCRQGVQRHPTGRVRREQLLDHHGGDRVDLDCGWITRPLRVQPVAVGRPRPGQQLPAAQPSLPPAPHPVGDQGPLVLGDRPADLGHQLLVRVVSERPIDEHHRHAAALQLLQHHHLVHEVAGQPVRRSHQHHVKGRAGCVVAKRVQAGTAQLGTAVAVIAEGVLLGDGPSVVGGDIGPQLGDLLLDGLGLLLAVGGHAHVQRHSHQSPLAVLLPPPNPTPAGRPGPTAPARPVARWSPAGPRRCAAWLPLSTAEVSDGGVHPPGSRFRSGRRHHANRSWP